MKRTSSFACLVGGAALLVPQAALAFCRTTTVERPVGMCPETCVTEGIPLFWSVPDPEYVFNVRGFPGLDDAELRAVFARAFDRWNQVRCPASVDACEDSDEPEGCALPIGLDIQAAPGTTTLEVGPEDDEPNENVVVHFSGEEWANLRLNPEAYALTAIWFNKNNGEILGADMHFNGGMGQFGVCPDTGCRSANLTADLENVATHEIGHFIGLAHSDLPTSTMWCRADPGELIKRDLHPDDEAGACDIYPPGEAFPSPVRADGGSNGCTVLGPAASGAGPLGFLIALPLLLRRRRRFR